MKLDNRTKKFYKEYGNENTDLTLTPKASEAYSGCDYTIREYSDGTYQVWLDNHAEVTGLTADDLIDYFESMADECADEID